MSEVSFKEICGLSVTGENSEFRLHGNVTKGSKTEVYVATVKMFRIATGFTVGEACENLHAQLSHLFPDGYHLQCHYFK